MFGADEEAFAVGENDFHFDDVIGGGAINRSVGAAGIIGDHAAEGGARAGGDVGAEAEAMRTKKMVQLIEDYAGADAHGALCQVEIGNIMVVTCEVDDQAFADCAANQTCAGTAGDDWEARLGGGDDGCTGLLAATGKGYGDRLDLVNRGVSGVKLPGQIVERDGTVRVRQDGLLLGRSHVANLGYGRGL